MTTKIMSVAVCLLLPLSLRGQDPVAMQHQLEALSSQLSNHVEKTDKYIEKNDKRVGLIEADQTKLKEIQKLMAENNKEIDKNLQGMQAQGILTSAAVAKFMLKQEPVLPTVVTTTATSPAPAPVAPPPVVAPAPAPVSVQPPVATKAPAPAPAPVAPPPVVAPAPVQAPVQQVMPPPVSAPAPIVAPAPVVPQVQPDGELLVNLLALKNDGNIDICYKEIPVRDVRQDGGVTHFVFNGGDMDLTQTVIQSKHYTKDGKPSLGAVVSAGHARPECVAANVPPENVYVSRIIYVDKGDGINFQYAPAGSAYVTNQKVFNPRRK